MGEDHPSAPLVLTAPHSGEEVPAEATWLKELPRELLLTDVDRFVHELYAPAVRELRVPMLVTRVHRYAVDLNRFPRGHRPGLGEDAEAPAGTHPKGFHWVATTKGGRLMSRPIARRDHDELVRSYHDRFHEELARACARLRGAWGRVYHLDCHSMPSVGRGAHRDGGERRADVVVSDLQGKSASPAFKDRVIGAFESQGLKVSYNWPYYGGRITERYGRPSSGHETVQIELNRALYMDEASFERSSEFTSFQGKVGRALETILAGLSRAR